MWTGIAQSFIAFLRLFSHFIIRGWTILTTIGRCSGGAGLAPRDTGNGWWWWSHTLSGHFREHLGRVVCFLGSGFETINGSCGFWVGERDTFWGCTGNAQDANGVEWD
ncbi:hypothetical protein CABS01_10186 [Colletotrichum abscissum]|nr:uncharacterized protein CABS01_10186 [Colletotrichum abscissum]KAK1500462.1 hypothetical protein CABS01_10186 [Colletotrichum abscissum]